MIISPLNLINALRESDFYIEYLYTHGSCYQFFIFLRKIYPTAEPYISSDEAHVASMIDNELYDINGIVTEKGFRPMTKKDISFAENWSFRKNHLIKITECPNCEEPFIYSHHDEEVKPYSNY